MAFLFNTPFMTNQKKRTKYKISFLLIFLFTFSNMLLLSQEVEPVWGNWYRADTYLPIKLTKDSSENTYQLKNKYTEDQIKFTNDRPVESLLRVSHDATIVEVHAGKNMPKVYPLNIQILQTNKALIVIANQHQKEWSNIEHYACISVADLPELEASFQMVDAIILTKEYATTLNSTQVESIRNWVFLGGVLYFDNQSTMLQHSTLTVELLKPLIKKDNPRFSQLPENERKKIFHQYAQKVFNKESTSTVLNGKVGLFDDDLQNFAQTAFEQNQETVKWHLRANQNNFKKKSKIKAKVEFDQAAYLEKLLTVLFFCMLGATLLKFKHSFAICATISALSIIPILYATPVLKLDGHLDKMLLLTETLNYQAKTEILSIVKKKDQALTIHIEESNPFFCFTECNIKFIRNNQNKYQAMEIKNNQKEMTLHRKTFDYSFYATSKTEKNKPEIYMNQTPKQVFLVQESKMTELNFDVDSSQNILKIITTSPLNILDRDSFDQELWYPATNRAFYAEPIQYHSMVLVKGKINKINYTITPPLNIQETEYSLLLPNN